MNKKVALSGLLYYLVTTMLFFIFSNASYWKYIFSGLLFGHLYRLLRFYVLHEVKK